MDLRMSAVPTSGGLLGGGHFMEKNIKTPVWEKVTLNLGVHPPSLDVAAINMKPVTPPKSISASVGGTQKIRGQFWTVVRNMYNTLCSGPPVTWVNPDMVQPQFLATTAAMLQPIYAEAQYPMVDASVAGHQNPLLWYQTTPGSEFDYQDPLQSLAWNNVMYNTLTPGYPEEYIPSHKNEFQKSSQPLNPDIPSPKNKYHKSSQPLNPDAKEWVPSNFKECRSSVPKRSSTSPDVQKPLIISSMAVGFVEITDMEIEEVRKNMQNELPKKTQDHKWTETSNNNNNKQKPVSCEAKIEVVGIAADGLKESDKVAGICNKELPNCTTTNIIESEAAFGERQKDNDTSFDEQKDQLGLSYASIARKSPEPSLQKTDSLLEKECCSVESVKQPLPKIFMKDKKYPKEKAAPLMENKHRDPLPFRTASKTQKKSSRKFLRDLRELSPAKSDCSFTGSEGSFESTDSSEVMSRLCTVNSPGSVGRLPGSTSPREISVGSCSVYPKNMKQRSMSESSGSSSYVRTTSESSTGSVESLEIEFGDECDIGDDNLEAMCVLMGTCQSKSSSSGGEHPENSCVLPETSKSSKHPNNILAHILGLDNDSESEDSDDDTYDDSDWDDADECDTLVLDDTWETFGLCIPLMTNSSARSKSFDVCDNNVNNNNNSEMICDNNDSECNVSLEDINKQWEEEVTKEVMITSPSRVTFGDVCVHPMVTWSYAYRNARRGPWEQHARDRVRFSSRISSLESVLSPVLEDSHRKAIYYKIYGS